MSNKKTCQIFTEYYNNTRFYHKVGYLFLLERSREMGDNNNVANVFPIEGRTSHVRWVGKEPGDFTLTFVAAKRGIVSGGSDDERKNNEEDLEDDDGEALELEEEYDDGALEMEEEEDLVDGEFDDEEGEDEFGNDEQEELVDNGGVTNTEQIVTEETNETEKASITCDIDMEIKEQEVDVIEVPKVDSVKKRKHHKKEKKERKEEKHKKEKKEKKPKRSKREKKVKVEHVPSLKDDKPKKKVKKPQKMIKVANETYTLTGELCRAITSPVSRFTLQIRKSATRDAFEIIKIVNVMPLSIFSLSKIKTAVKKSFYFGTEDVPAKKRNRSFSNALEKISMHIPKYDDILSMETIDRIKNSKHKEGNRMFFIFENIEKKMDYYDIVNHIGYYASNALSQADIDIILDIENPQSESRKLDIFSRICISYRLTKEMAKLFKPTDPSKLEMFENERKASSIYHKMIANKRRWGNTKYQEREIGKWKDGVFEILKKRNESIFCGLDNRNMRFIQDLNDHNEEDAFADCILRMTEIKMIDNNFDTDFPNISREYFADIRRIASSYKQNQIVCLCSLEKRKIFLSDKTERDFGFIGDDKKMVNTSIKSTISRTSNRGQFSRIKRDRDELMEFLENSVSPDVLLIDRAHLVSKVQLIGILKSYPSIDKLILAGSSYAFTNGYGSWFHDLVKGNYSFIDTIVGPFEDFYQIIEQKVIGFFDTLTHLLDSLKEDDHPHANLFTKGYKRMNILTDIIKDRSSTNIVVCDIEKYDYKDACLPYSIIDVKEMDLSRVIKCIQCSTTQKASIYFIGKLEDLENSVRKKDIWTTGNLRGIIHSKYFASLSNETF